MRTRALVLIATLLTLGPSWVGGWFGAPPAFAEQIGGRRVALVIGNGGYRSVDRLPNPPNDARLMAATLRQLGFELVGGGALIDLDRQHMGEMVQAFGQAVSGADVGLFYYSGHGLQVAGVNWLVPIDANPTRPQDLDFQMVDADLVLRQMDGAGTKLNLVLLDACRNNPFATRGVRGVSTGLAEMRAPEGTLISYATQPGNVAVDGSGSNSPYTLAVVDSMRAPGADVFRVFNQVGLRVKRATGGVQQPWVSTSPIEGEFYFAGPPPSQLASVDRLPSRTPERLPPSPDHPLKPSELPALVRSDELPQINPGAVAAAGVAGTSPAPPPSVVPSPPSTTAPIVVARPVAPPAPDGVKLDAPQLPAANVDPPRADVPRSGSLLAFAAPLVTPDRPLLKPPVNEPLAPPVPPPVIKSQAPLAERVRTLAEGHPCARIDLLPDDPGARVYGLAGSSSDWPALSKAIDDLAIHERLARSVTVLPTLACATIEALGTDVLRTRARPGDGHRASNAMLEGPAKDVEANAPFEVTLAGEADRLVFIDVLRPDGVVEHPAFQSLPGPSAERRSFRVPASGGPAGPRLVIAITLPASTTIVSGADFAARVRTTSEPAPTYLASVAKLLRTEPEARVDVARLDLRALPHATPAAASVPSLSRSPRCSAIVERAQVGDVVSDNDRAFLRSNCR